MRQALAGLLWSQAVLPLRRARLARGRPGAAARRRAERRHGRNREWAHLYNADVISMPDKWEYPWYAAWDLAFHCVPLALVDAEFAKEQLVLMLREWYMHPNGQLPAYEWAFGDVNPPVHAWAAWRVYKIDEKRTRRRRPRLPRARLPQAAAQLHLVGEPQGRRGQATSSRAASSASTTSASSTAARRCRPAATSSSRTAPAGWRCTASTCWPSRMELARRRPGLRGRRQQVLGALPLHRARDEPPAATTAARAVGRGGRLLLRRPAPARRHARIPLKVRSMVGLIPLFAVETLEPEHARAAAGFKRRLEWFVEHRPDLTGNVACMQTPGSGERRLLSVVDRDRLRRVLQRHARRARVPVAVRHPRAVARAPATQPYVAARRRHTSIASTTSRASRRPGCSAATRTGAGRSGSRSTSC